MHGVWMMSYLSTVDIRITEFMRPEETAEEFCDNHGLYFGIKKKHLKKIIKELGFKNLKDFMNTYTWDHSTQVYNIAKERGQILKEHIGIR